MNIVELGEVPARSLGMPLADFVLLQQLPGGRFRRRGRGPSPRKPRRRSDRLPETAMPAAEG